jgi:RNA polymerase sigma-B factor
MYSGDVATAYLTKMSHLDHDDPEFVRLRADVLEECIPLARAVASRFARRGEESADLVQVALLAACKAVDRFDPERGVNFENYVVPTMAGELKRYFRDHGWMLRVRRQLQELHLQIRRAVPELSQTLGRTPSSADVAEYLGVTPAEVDQGRDCAVAYRAYSLNAPVAVGDTEVDLSEVVGAVDVDLERVPDRHALREAVAALPERERNILVMRFWDCMTQAEIARIVGLSQMHVSRLLAKSLSRLRFVLDS